MKEDSKRTYQKLKNDLERMGPDTDLDYREEDLLMNPEKEKGSPGFWEDTKRFAKNFLVATLCVIIALLWWFDWNFSALANQTSDVISGLFGDQVAEVTAPSAPEMPPLPTLPEMPDDIEEQIRSEMDQAQNELEMQMSEYVSGIEEAGYRDQFSMPALSAMYRAGVEISYLEQLDEEGILDKLSFAAIVTFHSADIPVDYLVEMDRAGHLERFNFPGVAALYSGEVPVSYLNELEEQGQLEELSFPDIIVMYQSE